MSDVAILRERNEHFIEAFRQGSWDMLRQILSESFVYLAGDTGEVWPLERYIANLEGNPVPDLWIDQAAIHVDGDVAVVSARSHRGAGRVSRYIDTYERRDPGWLCVHACVWPLTLA